MPGATGRIPQSARSSAWHMQLKPPTALDSVRRIELHMFRSELSPKEV
jgi:hypothetical protein